MAQGPKASDLRSVISVFEVAIVVFAMLWRGSRAQPIAVLIGVLGGLLILATSR